MGLGDAAKAALSKAIEALQAIAEIKAIVQQLQVSSSNFERRLESRVESLEARIRELERENAKLHGQVNAAFADALRIAFFDQARERVRLDGTHPPSRTGSLHNGALSDASTLPGSPESEVAPVRLSGAVDAKASSTP